MELSPADVIVTNRNNEDYQFEYLVKRDGAKNVYLFSETKPMIKIGADKSFIGLLSDGNIFVADLCQEKSEQFVCSKISKIDKNGTELKLASDLSKYVYLINMVTNSFVSNGKRYLIVYDSANNSYNAIDESGKLIFETDRSSIIRLHSDYLLIDKNEIYNLPARRKLSINPDYKYVSTFPTHQLIVFSKKSDNKYVVYDLKKEKVLFESDKSLSEIPHTSAAVIRDYLYTGSFQNYNILNLKGEKISEDYYQRVTLQDNGTFQVENPENKVNILDPKTKKYLFDEFFDEISRDIYFNYLKKNGKYQIMDKNNKIIYSFEDNVTSIPATYGNLRYFSKSGGKKYDIYLSKDNTLLYKDAEHIRDVQDSNGFYIIIRLAPSKNIIVDKDGKVLVNERPIDGYLRYNPFSGNFEISKKLDGKPYLMLNKNGEEIK